MSWDISQYNDLGTLKCLFITACSCCKYILGNWHIHIAHNLTHFQFLYQFPPDVYPKGYLLGSYLCFPIDSFTYLNFSFLTYENILCLTFWVWLTSLRGMIPSAALFRQVPRLPFSLGLRDIPLCVYHVCFLYAFICWWASWLFLKLS